MKNISYAIAHQTKSPTIRPPLRLGVTLALLLVSTAAPGFAQRPSPQPIKPPVTINPDVAESFLGPEPNVTDWEPRGRVLPGGTIVFTGRDLKADDFKAWVGNTVHGNLPVLNATPSRIEVKAPDNMSTPDSGIPLIVAHKLGKAKTLETNYRVRPLEPAISEMRAGNNIYPFMKTSLTVRVKDFPGAKLDVNKVSFEGTGSCSFVEMPNISYGSKQRESDFDLDFSVTGYFKGSGTCSIRVRLTPQNENGSDMSPVSLPGSIQVNRPTVYQIQSTSSLTAKLNFESGGGVHGGDISFIARHEPLSNVALTSSSWKSQAWVLPAGVIITDIKWKFDQTGDKCTVGTDGSGGIGNFTFNRGSMFVNPRVTRFSDYVLFSDTGELADGEVFASNLDGPRQMIRPMIVELMCFGISSHEGRDSIRATLDSMTFEGPAGITLP